MATEDESSRHGHEVLSSDINMESRIKRKRKFVDPVQHEVKKRACDESCSSMIQQEMISSLNLQLTEKDKMIEQLEGQLNMIGISKIQQIFNFS